jgi:hypothetical protein
MSSKFSYKKYPNELFYVEDLDQLKFVSNNIVKKQSKQ